MGGIRLRVLHVGAKNFPPDHGGTERLVYDLVRGMPEIEGHAFVEWGHDGGYPRVRRLPRGIIARWRTIREYVRKNAIDIVHIHKSSNIPLALALKLSGLKCILTVHGCVWRRAERRWSPLTKILFWILDCIACVVLDRVVLVGDHDWLSFKKFFPQKKIALVQNGVSTEQNHMRVSRKGWVYLGRISPEKNILNLIKAANELPEELTIYGPISPPNSAYKRAFLRELECSNAEWQGPVPSDKVRSTLAKHRVFINPSFTEGLPFTVLEAAAEGLYLVLSDIRPHRLLGFPECSYVDPENLNLRPFSNMSLNGSSANHAHVVRQFDIEKTIRGYTDIYNGLAQST